MRGLWLVVGMVVLQGMDFILTGLLLSGQVRMDVYEANPLAQRILTAGGWLALATFKALCTLVALAAAVLVLRWRPETGRRLLAGLCLVLLGVVGYSAALAGGAGNNQELAPLHSDGLKVEQAQVTLRQYIRQRNDLCAALLLGEVSLAEAVERYPHIAAKCDTAMLAAFRRHLPTHAEPAARASYLLGHLARMLPDFPDVSPLRFAALQAECARMSSAKVS